MCVQYTVASNHTFVSETTFKVSRNLSWSYHIQHTTVFLIVTMFTVFVAIAPEGDRHTAACRNNTDAKTTTLSHFLGGLCNDCVKLRGFDGSADSTNFPSGPTNMLLMFSCSLSLIIIVYPSNNPWQRNSSVLHPDVVVACSVVVDWGVMAVTSGHAVEGVAVVAVVVVVVVVMVLAVVVVVVAVDCPHCLTAQ